MIVLRVLRGVLGDLEIFDYSEKVFYSFDSFESGGRGGGVLSGFGSFDRGCLGYFVNF